MDRPNRLPARRLLARLRVDTKPRLKYRPLVDLVLLPVFFVMQVKMLEGIKRRAEHLPPSGIVSGITSRRED